MLVTRVSSYESGRDEESFVEYLNEKAGTHRMPGGGLNDKAGRVPELDEVAAQFAEEPSQTVRSCCCAEGRGTARAAWLWGAQRGCGCARPRADSRMHVCCWATAA